MTSRRSGKEGVKESGMVVREDPRGVQAGEYGGRPGGTRRERGTLNANGTRRSMRRKRKRTHPYGASIDTYMFKFKFQGESELPSLVEDILSLQADIRGSQKILVQKLESLTKSERLEVNKSPYGFINDYMKQIYGQKSRAADKVVAFFHQICDLGFAPILDKMCVRTGEYPIVLSIRYNWDAVTQFLFTKAKVRITVRNMALPRNSPLTMAIKLLNTRLVETLIEFPGDSSRKKIDVNDEQGISALEVAVRSMHIQAIQILHKNEALLSDTAFRSIYLDRKRRLERHRLHKSLIVLGHVTGADVRRKRTVWNPKTNWSFPTSYRRVVNFFKGFNDRGGTGAGQSMESVEGRFMRARLWIHVLSFAGREWFLDPTTLTVLSQYPRYPMHLEHSASRI
ncbi:hypothetical protein AAMO2058_001260900 [Amorphochlora amoebiformis]